MGDCGQLFHNLQAKFGQLLICDHTFVYCFVSLNDNERAGDPLDMLEGMDWVLVFNFECNS